MQRPLRILLLVSTAALAPYLVAQQPGPQQMPDPQQQQQQQQQDEDPGRGVARISVINGDVNVRRGDSGEVVAAALNAPLQAQDRLMTGPNARAEIQLDFANFVRVGPGAEVRLSQVEDGRFQLQIAAGTVTFRMLRDSEAQVELATPNVAIHPLRRGAYRITVTPDGITEIAIRSGEADIYTQAGSEKIRQGQMMLVRGGADNAEFQMTNARGGDDWDRWNDNRDRDLEMSKSTQYVPRDVYGAEDLDHYGKWDYDPAYGNVWVPQTTQDWAPYRNGRWSWEDYYGWTWVSYDPWGWAPYHWGSWYQRPGIGWCWFPGASFGRHYWRPAVVGFFGWGGGVGVGFGFGHVGWVPLAPYERFHAWYGRGIYAGYRNGGFGGHTTIVNNTNIQNTYRNARVGNGGTANGVTSMPSNRFGRGGVDNRSYVRTSAHDIQQAGLVRGQLPVSPDRSSTRFADREVRGSSSVTARTNDNARFVSRNQPAPVSRVPFDQQQRGIENGVRQGNFNRAPGAASPSPNTGWRSVNEPARGGTSGPASVAGAANNGGFSNRGAAPQNSAQGSNSGGGWRRFEGSGNAGGSSQGGNPQGGSPNTGRGWSGYDPNRGGSSAPSGRSANDAQRGYRQGGGYSQPQPVRINPQIVRERPQGNYGGGNPAPRNYGGGGGTYSAPRPSGGSYSAPRPSGGGGSPAPRPSGGGGGSSARPSGGSGGGSHSSSGSSGRH